mmetsp:Transcript_17235/g.25543  ORF Transcript_17235/g.25543 Transcript_17235/m.25543 type:complete len:142 (+) Transcript_17235:1-426(+)
MIMKKMNVFVTNKMNRIDGKAIKLFALCSLLGTTLQLTLSKSARHQFKAIIHFSLLMIFVSSNFISYGLIYLKFYLDQKEISRKKYMPSTQAAGKILMHVIENVSKAKLKQNALKVILGGLLISNVAHHVQKFNLKGKQLI